MVMLAADYLEHQRATSDAALQRAAARITGDGKVTEAMRYAIAGGGKRLRPALCAASYEAIAKSEANQAVADLGAAIELIHTYSLVHDDLPCMDNDDVRRGRATTHRVFGVAAAHLAGAALIPLAFRLAAEAARELGLSHQRGGAIASALATAAGAQGMVGGQVLDIENEGAAVDLGRLASTHAAKTGALVRGACRIGAIAARASHAQLAAMDAYGAHLGMAFQIADDVLDETASTEQLGKTAGKDKVGDKATFPALLGLSGARQRADGEAAAAIAALTQAGLSNDVLAALCRFAVERNR